MAGPGKPTVRDVAARAGLSITTVSHVLNDVPGKRIADDTRRRVRAAAHELNYRPNRLAQGLRLQRTHTIGFVSDWIGMSPFAGMTILGAQSVAERAGYLLLLMNSGLDPELEDREIRALLDRQVDGIIYAAEYHREVRIPAALEGTPSVLLDATSTNKAIPSVTPDEVGGALGAVRELTKAGHRRIGFVQNDWIIPATEGRLKGYKQALREAGLRFSADLVSTAPSQIEGGFRAASRLLDLPDRPTALFCYNDRMAMGAFQAAAERGLSIPEDLSVIGYDNMEIIASGLRPGLTTMELPHFAMGEWAVTTLLAMLDAKRPLAAKQVALPCPLVRRFSVAPPAR